MDIYEIDNQSGSPITISFATGGSYTVASGNQGPMPTPVKPLATIPNTTNISSFLGLVINGTQYYLSCQSSGTAFQVYLWDANYRKVTPKQQGLVTPNPAVLGYKIQSDGIIIIGTSDY